MAVPNSPAFVVQRGFQLPAAPTANSDTAAVMSQLLSPEQQAQFYQQQLAQMYANSQAQLQQQDHSSSSMVIPHFSSWPSPGSSDDLTEALHSFINLDGHPSPQAQSLSSSVSTVTNNTDALAAAARSQSASTTTTLPAASSPGSSGAPAATAAPGSMPIASKPWTNAADRFQHQHANPHSLGSTIASSSSSSSASTFATTLPSQSYNSQSAHAAAAAGGGGFNGAGNDNSVKSIFNFHGYNPVPGQQQQQQPQSPPFLLPQLPMHQQIPPAFLASQLPYSLQAQWLQFQSQTPSPMNLPLSSNTLSPQTSISPLPPQSPLSASSSRPESGQRVDRDGALDRATSRAQVATNANGASLSHHSHGRSFSSAFSQAALHSPGQAVPSPALSSVSSGAMTQPPPAEISPTVNPEDLARNTQSVPTEASSHAATVAKRNTSRGRSSVVKSPTEDTSRGRTPSTGRAPVQRPSRSKTRRPSYSRTISPHASKDGGHHGQMAAERGRPGPDSGLRHSVSSGTAGANGSQDATGAASLANGGGGGPPTRQMGSNNDPLSRSVSSSSAMPYMPGYPGAASSPSINIGSAKSSSSAGSTQGPPSSMQRYGASMPTYMEGSGSWQGGSFSASGALRSPQLDGRNDFGSVRGDEPRSPSSFSTVPPALHRRQSDTFSVGVHQAGSDGLSKDDSPMSRNIPLPNLGDFGDRVAIDSPKTDDKEEGLIAAPSKRSKASKEAAATLAVKHANGGQVAGRPTISPTEDREMGSPGVESDRDGDDMHEGDDKVGKGGKTVEDRRKKRRESHNAVERRRRDNINDRIMELARLIPEVLLDPASAAAAASASSGSKRSKDRNAGSAALSNGLAGSPPLPTSVATFTPAQLAQQQASNKPNKGIILTKSVEYIEYLHQIVQISSRRNRELEERVQHLEQAQARMAAEATSAGSAPQAHEMGHSPYATYHQHLSEQQRHKSSGSSASASGSTSTSGGHRSSASASASPSSLLGGHCGGQPLATVEERMLEEGNASDKNETSLTYEELLGYANASPAKVEEDEHDHEMVI